MTGIGFGDGFERRLTARLLGPIGLFLIVQFAVGCGTMATPTTSSSGLIGQWRQTHLVIDGELKQCPTSLTTLGGPVGCGADDTVEFKKDGAFLASVSGLPVQVLGKWRLDASTLQVTFTEPPEVAGTTTSALVQLDPASDRLTINPTGVPTPTAAIYIRQTSPSVQ